MLKEYLHSTAGLTIDTDTVDSECINSESIKHLLYANDVDISGLQDPEILEKLNKHLKEFNAMKLAVQQVLVFSKNTVTRHND